MKFYQRNEIQNVLLDLLVGAKMIPARYEYSEIEVMNIDDNGLVISVTSENRFKLLSLINSALPPYLNYMKTEIIREFYYGIKNANRFTVLDTDGYVPDTKEDIYIECGTIIEVFLAPVGEINTATIVYMEGNNSVKRMEGIYADLGGVLQSTVDDVHDTNTNEDKGAPTPFRVYGESETHAPCHGIKIDDGLIDNTLPENISRHTRETLGLLTTTPIETSGYNPTTTYSSGGKEESKPRLENQKEFLGFLNDRNSTFRRTLALRYINTTNGRNLEEDLIKAIRNAVYSEKVIMANVETFEKIFGAKTSLPFAVKTVGDKGFVSLFIFNKPDTGFKHWCVAGLKPQSLADLAKCIVPSEYSGKDHQEIINYLVEMARSKADYVLDHFGTINQFQKIDIFVFKNHNGFPWIISCTERFYAPAST